MSPTTLVKLYLPEQNCNYFKKRMWPQEDSVKNAINYKCLSVISKLPV